MTMVYWENNPPSFFYSRAMMLRVDSGLIEYVSCRQEDFR
jgi:hypothetical protein